MAMRLDLKLGAIYAITFFLPVGTVDCSDSCNGGVVRCIGLVEMARQC